ncbi:heat shock protein 9/12-domain-containing protein [Crassisporium funariophilum]|nr:heat shock protein 9/12-domain-containing protein [Crassisporium funariophilum]
MDADDPDVYNKCPYANKQRWIRDAVMCGSARHPRIVASRYVTSSALEKRYKMATRSKIYPHPSIPNTSDNFSITTKSDLHALVASYSFLIVYSLDRLLSSNIMSDAGRQSFTDKAGSAMKPDSQKGTFEQAGDKLKGTADSMASSMQPNSQKSGSQRLGDTASGNSNENSDSMLNKAKNAVGMGNNNNST